MLMHLVGSFTSRGQRLEASGLQPLIEFFWKIACLRHAIFRGTPGNLRAASLRSSLTYGWKPEAGGLRPPASYRMLFSVELLDTFKATFRGGSLIEVMYLWPLLVGRGCIEREN